MPRQRGLQAAALQFVGVRHGCCPARICGRSYRLRRRACPPCPSRPTRLAPARLLHRSRSSPAARRCIVRQPARRHHALPHRGRAGQRRHEGAGRRCVKPGMTRAQVRDILGSPLLTDVFHADRWDYVFTLRRQGAEPQRRSVVVLLRRREAEERRRATTLPSEREFVAVDQHARKRRARAPKLELSARPSAAGAAGAGAPAPPTAPPAPGAARCASTRRSSRDDASTAQRATGASPSPAPPAAWAAC